MDEKLEQEPKVKSIEKGFGEGSIFFHTISTWSLFTFVDEIKEEMKQIGSDLAITVYRGYLNGKLKFEMGASIDVTIIYH